MKYIEKIFNFSSATHPDTLTVLTSDPNYVSPEGGSSEGITLRCERLCRQRSVPTTGQDRHDRQPLSAGSLDPRGVPTLRRISIVKTSITSSYLSDGFYGNSGGLYGGLVAGGLGGFPAFFDWVASFAFSRSAFSLQNCLWTHIGGTVACFGR